jgi:hypothetical protein
LNILDIQNVVAGTDPSVRKLRKINFEWQAIVTQSRRLGGVWCGFFWLLALAKAKAKKKPQQTLPKASYRLVHSRRKTAPLASIQIPE